MNCGDRLIIKVGKLSGPLGGVTVFNQRLLRLLNKSNVSFLFFSYGADSGDCGVHNLTLDFYKLPCLLNFVVIREAYELYKSFDGLVTFSQSIKAAFYAYQIYRRVRHENSEQISVLTDYLGLNQLVPIVLKRLLGNVRAYTYLHGAGLLSLYDHKPNLYRKLASHTDMFVGSTAFMGRVLEEKTSLTNYAEVPCFLEEKQFGHVVTKHKNIIFVGALTPNKNVRELINQFYNSGMAQSEYKLIVIGDGSEKESLEELTRELNCINCIEFTGQLAPDIVDQYIGSSRYLVLPSAVEAFGLVVIEAMAKGTVPIVSNTGGKPFIVEDTGGYVYEHKKPLQLLNILKKITHENDSDFKALSNKAYQGSLRYSETIAGKRMVDLLKHGE